MGGKECSTGLHCPSGLTKQKPPVRVGRQEKPLEKVVEGGSEREAETKSLSGMHMTFFCLRLFSVGFCFSFFRAHRQHSAFPP